MKQVLFHVLFAATLAGLVGLYLTVSGTSLAQVLKEKNLLPADDGAADGLPVWKLQLVHGGFRLIKKARRTLALLVGHDTAMAGERRLIHSAFMSNAAPLTCLPDDATACVQAQDFVIPAAGAAPDTPARIYKPARYRKGQPHCGIVFYHGGGWTFGNLHGSDHVLKLILLRANCVAVSVDYRLAPENRFPAAFDDSYEALRYVVNNAAALDIDPARIAVMGDSAGGNLAAAVSLKDRDEKKNSVAFQVLIYPAMLDRFNSTSYADNKDGPILTLEDMVEFWDNYRAPAHAHSPYFAPLRADSLAALPPALVMLAGRDVLHDDGQEYATRLQAAGVPVEVLEYPPAPHGLVSITRPPFTLPMAFTVLQDLGDAVARKLA